MPCYALLLMLLMSAAPALGADQRQALLPAGFEGTWLERIRIDIGKQTSQVRAHLGEGWWDGEGSHRWSGRDGKPAELKFDVCKERDYVVILRLEAPVNKVKGEFQLNFYANDVLVKSLIPKDRWLGVRLVIPHQLVQAVKDGSLTLKIDSPFHVPKQLGINPDTRTLGVAVHHVEIVSIIRTKQEVSVDRSPKGNIAILNEPSLPVEGKVPSPEELRQLLKGAALRHAQDIGYGVTFLRAVDLANPNVLNTDNFDLLILPYGASFPAPAREALLNFLSAGGDLITMGGYAFDNLLVPHEGKWLRMEELNSLKGANPVLLFDFEGDDLSISISNWRTGSDANVQPQISLASEGADETKRSLKLHTPRLSRWDTVSSPNISKQLSARHTVTRFFAKGDEGTTRLFVEWQEKDGSRWDTIIVLTPQWKEYMLFADKLRYRLDSPSKGRGFAGDRFHPQNARGMAFGVSVEAGVAKSGEAYTFQIDQVSVEEERFEAYRDTFVNTRHGFQINPAGFLRVAPEQIGVFDPSYTLQGVAYAKADDCQFILDKGLLVRGNFEGYSAIGMTGIESTDRCRWVPLLTAYDRYHRPRGTVAGLTYNFGEPFKGSLWAYFGVTNADLFAERIMKSEIGKALAGIVSHLLRGLFLHSTRAEFVCYRQGEPVRIITNAANYGKAKQAVKVTLQILALDEATNLSGKSVLYERTQRVQLGSGEDKTLTFEWRPAKFEHDFYLVRSILKLDGNVIDIDDDIDMEYNGFVVWDERVVRRGLDLQYRDCYFWVDGKPQFLLGVQHFWGDKSWSGASPLVWEREFQAMQNAGIKVARIINVRSSWVKEAHSDEELTRYEDALVQLAQKHKVALFFETHLWPSSILDDAAREREAHRCRQVAERYRDVKGLFIDLQNEPIFQLEDNPAQRRGFGQFLKERYGTIERLKEAWRKSPPEGDFGEIAIKLPDGDGDWEDMRAVDTHAFGVAMLRQWAKANCQAVKMSDPKRLVSVGFTQGGSWRYVVLEPLIASKDLDFTNRHYYGDLAGFNAALKETDMRWAGKAPSIGEFGSTCHPSFVDKGFYDAPSDQINRYLLIPHAALGMGAMFVSNWHFRDPTASIFPFGLTYPDLVEKDVLKLYRGMALLFEQFRLKYKPPSVYLVTPESHRLGHAAGKVTEAVHNAINLLISCRVDFSVIPETELGKLPPDAKALFYPIPYCPDDTSYERIKAFVQNGGLLYFSGDISYDTLRQRTRLHRLRELAGVEFTSERYPNISFLSTSHTLIRAVQGFHDLKPFHGFPCLTVKPLSAQVIATDEQGSPVVFLNQLGKGKVFYIADPLELHADVEQHRTVYQRFLRFAAIPSLSVTPDDPNVQAFSAETQEGGTLYVLINTDAKPHEIQIMHEGKPITLTLGVHRPGLVLLDRKGRVKALETSGKVAVGARTIVESQSHLMVASKDGLTLDESKSLFVFPLSRGTIRIASRAVWKKPVVSVVEFRGGKWKTLEQLKARAEKACITFQAESHHALNVLIIAEERKR